MRWALVAAPALLLSACASPTEPLGPPWPEVNACASWVDFDTVQDMYDGSTLVVTAVVGPQVGMEEFDTGPGERHEIDVVEVHRGDLDAQTIVAASPRDYCTGVGNPPDPEGDRLVAGDRVLLFLRPLSAVVDPGEAAQLDPDDVDRWAVLTPFDGILPARPGEELPFEP